MNKLNRIVLFAVVLLVGFSVTSISAENGITPIRLIGDFWSCPIQYEFSQSSFHTTFNGTLFVGARVKKFTFGGSFQEHYYSLNNGEPLSGLTGGQNLMRLMGAAYYQPVDWFELNWGLGVSWLSTAFDYRSTGEINQQKVGVGMEVDVTFRPPWKYVQFRLINRLDLLFSINTQDTDYEHSLKLVPVFYTGGRVDFHPYYDWLNVYLEVGGSPWIYASYPAKFVTGQLFVNVGISVDMTFPKTIKAMKRMPVIRSVKLMEGRKVEKRVELEPVIEEPVKLTSTEIDSIKEETVSDKIRKILKAKKGDVIVFTEINFYPDSPKLLESSLPMLNDLVAALLKRRDILKFEMAGHTNSLGSPKIEKDLSVQRAETVANYLRECGIYPNRISTTGYGGTRTMVDGIDVINRRVELRIIKIKAGADPNLDL